MKFPLILFFVVASCSSVGSVEDMVNLDQGIAHVKMLTQCAPRVTGSGDIHDTITGGVYSAAEYIVETLQAYQYTVFVEKFPVTTFQITEFELVVDFDGDFSTPDQLTLSTAIPPTLQYSTISYHMHIPLVLDEKVPDTVPGLEYWVYQDMELEPPEPEITLVYRVNEPAFVCSIPDAFSISYQDYLIINQYKTETTALSVKFLSHSADVTGYNIVAFKEKDQEKDQKQDQKIIVTAHYDSVFTKGAIDNGSGVASLLETARIISELDTVIPVWFVFFDAEEIGCLGSEAFVAAHDLDHSVCINVDSIASGDTVYIGGFPYYPDIWMSYYHTDPDLDRDTARIAKSILGYTPDPWYLEYAGGYSDFVSFTREKIPCTDITTFDKEAVTIPVISEEKQSENAVIWKKGDGILYYQEDRFSKVIPFIHTSHDDLAHFNQDLFYDAARVVTKATYALSTHQEKRYWGGLLCLGAAAIVAYSIWHIKVSGT
ncbi:MAG: M28 family peptidase [Candidatus Methanofastidiosia archaeon]